MNYLHDIKTIELEISSDCNAACPGCMRTQSNKYAVRNITIDEIKGFFPTKAHILNKHFKLCGNLGDPIVNPDCLPIVEYLIDNGAKVGISTNGGYNTVEFWKRLGDISASTQRLDVGFAIDGFRETNHIYRVNTNFKVIERNLLAYKSSTLGDARAAWPYILFDHNEHEVELARAFAAEHNIFFMLRTSGRNIDKVYTSSSKRKDENNKLLVTETTFTASDRIAHDGENESKKLLSLVKSKDTISDEEALAASQSITCRHIHEKEIFISHDKKLWPCCFLSNNIISEKLSGELLKTMEDYPGSWNDLAVHTIDEVLNHQWYMDVLKTTWNLKSPKHLTACITSCGSNKAYQNKFIPYNKK